MYGALSAALLILLALLGVFIYLKRKEKRWHDYTPITINEEEQ